MTVLARCLATALLAAACAPAVPGSPTMPEAMHGRWGLVPADCTTTRGDEKGLLVVDATTLRFYESRATIERVAARTPERVEGTFAFTGEGMAWTRRMTLALDEDGTVLVRTDHDDPTLPGPLHYTACL